MKIKRLTQQQYLTARNCGRILFESYMVNTLTEPDRVMNWIEWLYKSAGKPLPKVKIIPSPYKPLEFPQDPNVIQMAYDELIKKRGAFLQKKYSMKIREWMYQTVYDRRYSRLHAAINQILSRHEGFQKRIENQGAITEPYATFDVMIRAAAAVGEVYRQIDAEFPATKLYNKITEFADLNLYGMEVGTKECWASVLPMKADTHPETRRLHSETGPAILWRDGQEHYFLHGTVFPKNIWESVIKSELNVKQIMTWRNYEQIRAALRYLGPDALLRECKVKLISSTVRGNKLYQVKNVYPLGGIKILVYKCPSTGREYRKFVDSTIKNADYAQAWRHGLSVEEYLTLKES